MAKMKTLTDYEKKVKKEEDALLNLQAQLEELEQTYNQRRSQMMEKIKQQTIKVREAESDRLTCLLEESGLDFMQAKELLLKQQVGGEGHV